MFEKEKSLLDETIEKALRELDRHTIGSEEYVKVLNCVIELHKLKMDENPPAMSKDALLSIGANLLGIVMIIKHERFNVITSKALSFVLRTR